jgi:hypothetical protein
MKKNILKSFFNHSWSLVIGGAIFSYALPSIHMSITQNISVVLGLYNVGKIIINFIVRVFMFRIPVWILLLVILGLLFILIFISMISANRHSLPKWRNYTHEYYGEWLFEWNYKIRQFGGTEIDNLRPICNKCYCDLSNRSNYLYCPNCNAIFPDVNYTILANIEKIIIRNLKTGEYKLK